MTRVTYVLRGGALIDKREAPPLHASAPAPMVRPDGMAPLRSMADGRIYESRSAYYAAVRAAGCEIVGDERAAFDRRGAAEPARAGADIKAAIDQLRSR